MLCSSPLDTHKFLPPQKVEFSELSSIMPSFSDENSLQTTVGEVALTSVYVHLISGEVAIISPATDVVVQSHMVLVYNGAQPVASYPRREVFSCSKTETSPTLT